MLIQFLRQWKQNPPYWLPTFHRNLTHADLWLADIFMFYWKSIKASNSVHSQFFMFQRVIPPLRKSDPFLVNKGAWKFDVDEKFGLKAGFRCVVSNIQLSINFWCNILIFFCWKPLYLYLVDGGFPYLCSYFWRNISFCLY